MNKAFTKSQIYIVFILLLFFQMQAWGGGNIGRGIRAALDSDPIGCDQGEQCSPVTIPGMVTIMHHRVSVSAMIIGTSPIQMMHID